MTVNRRDINYEEIVLRRQPPTKLKRKRNHPIMAMDTETYKGYAKLICDSRGGFILNPSLDESLSFLSRHSMRVTHCFWYNMDYDIDAIIKRLPVSYLMRLHANGKVRYKDFYIKYLPKKLFSIRRGRDVVRFYDLYQFFLESLDSASQKYLKKGKTVLPFKTAALNEDIGVWNEYTSEIVRYCIMDAKLTAQLGGLLQRYLIQDIKLTPQMYISKAGLSKQYFRQNADIPDIHKIRKDVLRLGFYAYKGGRFELLKKGHFEHVELYDLKSAYASEIANLIDVTVGEWRYTKEVHEDAYYGFYVIDVDLPYRFILPLPYVTTNDVLIYPYGLFTTVVTKQEIDATLQPKEYEVRYGYEFYPSEIRYPFRDGIMKLFAIKDAADPESYLYDLAKKMSNSLYGSFYEKIKKEEHIAAGILFNPINASIITANTRVKAYLFALQHEEDTVAFATDSVLFDGKKRIADENKIGGWDLQADGDSVCIQSGLYQIDNKIKTRGFKSGSSITTPDGKYKSIFKYIQAFPERKIYKGTVKRPLHIVESLIHSKKYSINNVNRWIEFKKTLDINKDQKRVFLEEFKNGGELWKKKISSDPRFIGGF